MPKQLTLRQLESLAGRITSVRNSLEEHRTEAEALAEILQDLVAERDRIILDSRNELTAVELGAVLQLHESTIRGILRKQLRRRGMGAEIADRRQRTRF